MRSFVINLWFFLCLTIFVGFLTVIERKVLALVQRRVGPDHIGYRGRFQFIADSLKLLIKHIEVLFNLNRLLFIALPTTMLILCYLFWVNMIWGYNLNFFEIEYNMLIVNILSMCFTGFLFVLGFYTKNKYAILASYRLLLLNFNIEIIFNFLLILVLFFFKSFSLIQILVWQDLMSCGFLLFLPILPILLILFLLETNRIPFDLVEAESELIAGYTTELGGFFFAVLYFAEYFHLYSYSVIYSIILLGGVH